MEQIEVSAAGIRLAELVKRVSQDRIVVELADHATPLARIVPLERPHTLAELDQALRTCELGNDAEAFAADVLAARQSHGELDNPWES